jgi:hypothetical protein
MLNHLKLIAIVFLFNLNLSKGANAQEFTKNSIKLGLGIGASGGYNTDGLGFVYSVGYQKEIYKDRLRFNPNFSIGHYSSKFIMDAPDEYFNSINLETNLFFDLAKIKSFSLLIGTGAIINNTRGLVGTGGMVDYDSTYYPSSHYINDFHFGGSIMGGFRINPPNNRLAVDILLLNIHFGTNYFVEGHVKIQFDIKF